MKTGTKAQRDKGTKRNAFLFQHRGAETKSMMLNAFVNAHDTAILSPPRMKIPLHPPLQKGEAGGNGEPKRSPPFRKGGPGGIWGNFSINPGALWNAVLSGFRLSPE